MKNPFINLVNLLVVTMAFFFIVAPSFGENLKEGPKVLEHKLLAIKYCFLFKIMSAKSDTAHDYHPAFRTYLPGLSTDIALFEIIIRDHNFHKLTPEEYCETLFKEYSDKYIQALQVLAAEEKAQKPFPDLGLPGTRQMKGDSLATKLITGANNLWQGHVIGHSDLTKAALEEVFNEIEDNQGIQENVGQLCNCTPSELALEIIESASQLPDLYKWNDETFHAHSPPHDENDPNSVRIGTKIGKENFIHRFAWIIENVKSSADRFPEKALFFIGVGSHIVQDLVFHHGITMQQHSGLAFVTKFKDNRVAFINPDEPEGINECETVRTCPQGTPAHIQLTRALDLTKAFIIFTLKNIDQTTLAAMLHPKNTFTSQDLLDLAESVFGNEQDIDLLGLWLYFWKHSYYQFPYNSLKHVSDFNVPWNAETLLAEILK